MRRALLLPALFLIVVMPIWAFVLSGYGTHESPQLLYPFASPWWILVPWVDTPGWEDIQLLVGCTVNVVLLAYLGARWDRRAQKRNDRTPDSPNSQ